MIVPRKQIGVRLRADASIVVLETENHLLAMPLGVFLRVDARYRADVEGVGYRLKRQRHPARGAILLQGRSAGHAIVWFGPDAPYTICRDSLRDLGIRIKRDELRWYTLERAQ